MYSIIGIISLSQPDLAQGTKTGLQNGNTTSKEESEVVLSFLHLLLHQALIEHYLHAGCGIPEVNKPLFPSYV